MKIANSARKLLIRLGKVLPFVICFIVAISYIECVIAYLSDSYIVFDDYVTFNKPISTIIAEYFEYDAVMVVICLIISVAVETCKWNKISVLYLAIHLLFKNHIEDIELHADTIIIICIINIAITSYLVFKGVKIAFNS